MGQPIGIGVELGEDMIRVARLRRTPRGLVLQNLGAAPTPEGAMSGATVLDVRLLAEGVRNALRAAGLSGGAAMVGLPGRAAASRVLELPAMSHNEMKTVVAGEMEHLRMIPAGQGTFDFLTLTRAEEDTRRVRVLVMAADRQMVDHYREALRLAGVQMLALEPMFFAASRATFTALEHGGVGLITVGARASEFTVFAEGEMRYSRQIDVGVLDMLRPGAEKEGTLTPAEPAPITGIPSLERSGGDGQTLTFELQRSLGFYHREAPAAEHVERLLLVADMERLPGLDERLQDALGVPVTVCQPLAAVDDTVAAVPAPVSPAFAPALGLALRAVETAARAPRVDLSFTGRESQLAKAVPRWMVWATAASIVLVVGAIMGWLQLNATLHRREAELGQAKVELAQVSQEEQEQTSQARRVQEAQRMIQTRGLPWSDILFNLSSSMPERVWLTSVSAESGSTLTLDGTALAAGDVPALMEALARSPRFVNPEMRSMQKDVSTSHRELVRYQVKVQLTTELPVQAGVAPAPSTAVTTAGPAAAPPGTASTPVAAPATPRGGAL